MIVKAKKIVLGLFFKKTFRICSWRCVVDLWSVWLQGKTERKSQIDTESDQDLSSSCKSNTRWPSLVVRQTVILIRCQVSSPPSWQRKGWEQAQISHRNYYVTVLVIEIGMFLRSTSTSTRYKNSLYSNYPLVSAELCIAEVFFMASIAQVWLSWEKEGTWFPPSPKDL